MEAQIFPYLVICIANSYVIPHSKSHIPIPHKEQKQTKLSIYETMASISDLRL